MTPPPAALRWAAAATDAGELTVVRGLRDGGSPWLLRGADREAILRIGDPALAGELATEATLLERRDAFLARALALLR